MRQAKMRSSTFSFASIAMLGGFDIAHAVCAGSNLAIGTPVDLGTGNTQCKTSPISCEDSTLPGRAPQQEPGKNELDLLMASVARVLFPIVITTDHVQITSTMVAARPSRISRSAPLLAHVFHSTSSVLWARRPLKATMTQQPESRTTARLTRVLSPAEATWSVYV